MDNEEWSPFAPPRRFPFTPPLTGGDWPVFVAEVSQRKWSLVLEFSGVLSPVDLTGARFEEVPVADVPPAERERFVRFLEISFAGGTRWLLAESKPQFSRELVM